jgi:carbamoyltransferase
MSTVLGVNCTLQPDGSYTFEGNVALVRDGLPIFAIAQDRVSRARYDGRFEDALRYAYARTGVRPEELEAIAVSTFGQPTIPENETRRRIVEVVRAAAGSSAPIEIVATHHEAHAALAMAASGFDEALIAVIDGDGSIIGERRDPQLWRNPIERTSFYRVRRGALELIERDHDSPGEVGFGKAYARVTKYVGFGGYQHAGKTMGLAPFGDPSAWPELALFEPDAAGRFRTEMANSAEGKAEVSRWFLSRGVELPPPRDAGRPLRRVDLDLARWIQEDLERAIPARLERLAKREGTRRVCGAGGVFLNSVLNRRLHALFGPGAFFVPSAPGDSGLALGAAAWYLWRRDGAPPRWPRNPHLGGEYSVAELERAVKTHGGGFDVERCSEPERRAAEALARGELVGWFQGASEYGPRALGNRSILADPRNAWTKDVLNHQVKGREWFRPYAPAVLAEESRRYFDALEEVPEMMATAGALRSADIEAPACVHVDHTARIQTVREESNPRFAALIRELRSLTGVPIVLNTSFNLGGQPIVETPEDALACFAAADSLHHLFLGPLRISRRKAISGS